MMVRDSWRVARPAGFTGGLGAHWRPAECWDVTIVEERTASIRRTFLVTGELVAQIHPERWCIDTRQWLPVEAEPVPGVLVGGYRLNSLGLARERARDLITLLAGRMFFEDVRLFKAV